MVAVNVVKFKFYMKLHLFQEISVNDFNWQYDGVKIKISCHFMRF